MKRLYYWAAMIAILAAGAAAQNTGAIAGALRDGTGAVVPRAPVSATNEQTKAVFRTQATDLGLYSLGGLPAGNYRVAVDWIGFRPFLRESLNLAGGQTVRLDIRLEDNATLNTLGEFFFRREIREPPAGTTPRAPNGKPDLTGVWLPGPDLAPRVPEMLPSAEAIFKRRQANLLADPRGNCLPSGVARTTVVDLVKFIQTPSVLVMLVEGGDPGFRQIFLDGRPHPKDPFPTWMGHSTGKWEGDTLIVDTIGFNDQVWVDFAGHPQTEQMRITERYTRKDLGHMDAEYLLEDPGAYRNPWRIRRQLTLAPGEEIQEYLCSENNKDPQHSTQP